MENVLIGALLHCPRPPEARRQALEILELLGLAPLCHRPAASLTLPERKRLELARALATRPRLLLLDEPSLGLAPLVVKQIFQVVADINRERGMTVFMVEQNARRALKLAHRAYVMVNGVITLSGSGGELLADESVRAAYLEGGHGKTG
ncbi:hypothetical protein CCP1ISM_3090001 [Azospirillaceae bacterium]